MVPNLKPEMDDIYSLWTSRKFARNSHIFLSHADFKCKVLGPLSEIFGRLPVLQLSYLFYLGASCTRSSFFLSGDEIVFSLEPRLRICEVAGPISRVSVSCWDRRKCYVVCASFINNSIQMRSILISPHTEADRRGRIRGPIRS